MKRLALLLLLFAVPAAAAPGPTGHFNITAQGSDSLNVSPCASPESLIVNPCSHRMVPHVSWTGPSSGSAVMPPFNPHTHGWGYGRSQLAGGTYTVTVFYSWEFGPGTGCSRVTTVSVPFTLDVEQEEEEQPPTEEEYVAQEGGGSCEAGGTPPRPKFTITSN